jgi:hypothetical protein
VLTLACLLSMVEFHWADPDGSSDQLALTAAAWIIAAGSLLTCGTRLRAIARQLRAR